MGNRKKSDGKPPFFFPISSHGIIIYNMLQKIKRFVIFFLFFLHSIDFFPIIGYTMFSKRNINLSNICFASCFVFVYNIN